MSDWIAGGLEAWGQGARRLVEDLFLNAYGAPWLQAADRAGSANDPAGTRPAGRAGYGARGGREADGLPHLGAAVSRAAGCLEAAVRALLYIRMPDGVADERGFAALRQIAK